MGGCDPGGTKLKLLQYPEELRLSLHRLNILPDYANVPLFQEFNSPLGGTGLQALVDIPFGFPIISEPELFSRVEGQRLTRAQKGFANFKALSCPDDPWTADRTFGANSFGMGTTAQNQEIHGIFLQSSRLNHSCVPNAHFAWNRTSQRLTVHAIENIPRDNEILVNYRIGNYRETRDARRAELSEHYGFICTCRACDQRPLFGSKSEERRRQIRDLDDYIERNRNSKSTDVRARLLANIRASITLLNKEGLIYPRLADMYSEAVWWYEKEMERATGAEHSGYKVACLETALQIARDQLYLDVACNGHDSPVVQERLNDIAELKQKGMNSHNYSLRSSRR